MKKYFVRMKCKQSPADYLTAGKWYEIDLKDDEEDLSGYIMDDFSNSQYILQKGCAHLENTDWEVKELHVSGSKPKDSELTKVFLNTDGGYSGLEHLAEDRFPIEAWGVISEDGDRVDIYYDQLLNIGLDFKDIGRKLCWLRHEFSLIEEDVVCKEAKQSSPRYHHKRTPPPVRKKTDLTIHYSNNKKYTIKNVKKLSVVSGEIIGVEYISGGFERTISIPIKGVNYLAIKSPNKFTLLTVYKNSLSGVTKKGGDYRVMWDGNFYEETFK